MIDDWSIGLLLRTLASILRYKIEIYTNKILLLNLMKI